MAVWGVRNRSGVVIDSGKHRKELNISRAENTVKLRQSYRTACNLEAFAGIMRD